ncbi:hypothetical protein BCR33DRAFT_786164 [Rhizoclosmatium globosum]|uniref:NYN domain-containing protein n=1 Tax=Rhizoclosmatium globosum TaxID=329046 RepID=A0A1Y2C963_9FUNG|nr:hypothetical protein BCR33DRAFT_786148 [Rhizoclosmatium globosum]ORY42885.1 hypothetical protein BCR33DRAFT_786164 [Rhizoclosmatium globosum]|eukprot:ORY42855.1 hypothetical protein BCR33DRAFT_786148 [Rhizoclosmatium globosum]
MPRYVYVFLDSENVPPGRHQSSSSYFQAIMEPFMAPQTPGEEVVPGCFEVMTGIRSRNAGTNHQISGYRAAGCGFRESLVDEPEAADSIHGAGIRQAVDFHMRFRAQEPATLVHVSSDTGFFGPIAAAVHAGFDVVVVHTGNRFSLTKYHALAQGLAAPTLVSISSLKNKTYTYTMQPRVPPTAEYMVPLLPNILPPQVAANWQEGAGHFMRPQLLFD